MYEAFFGLREKPFHVTADPAFLYPSHQHEEAMAHLMYGIRERLGFLMITGEVGTGKTTLAKALIEKLKQPTKTALILNPALSGTQLLRAILLDFGLGSTTGTAGDPPKRLGSTRGELLQTVEQFLLGLADTNGVGVLIIDEAQALSPATLEQVRLLSNVETPKAKLLQIILIGQPELAQHLKKDARLRALHERIAVRYHIQPLSETEVADYIDHRLKIAGSTGIVQFTPEAISSIAQLSGGIPRRINLLCDQALVAGFVHESTTIDPTLVGTAQGALPAAPEPVATGDHANTSMQGANP